MRNIEYEFGSAIVRWQDLKASRPFGLPNPALDRVGGDLRMGAPFFARCLREKWVIRELYRARNCQCDVPKLMPAKQRSLDDYSFSPNLERIPRHWPDKRGSIMA